MQNNKSEFLPFLAIRHFKNERKAEQSQLSQRLLGVLLNIGKKLANSWPVHTPVTIPETIADVPLSFLC